jgi:hypothetical protein
MGPHGWGGGFARSKTVRRQATTLVPEFVKERVTLPWTRLSLNALPSMYAVEDSYCMWVHANQVVCPSSHQSTVYWA